MTRTFWSIEAVLAAVILGLLGIDAKTRKQGYVLAVIPFGILGLVLLFPFYS